MNKDVIYIEPEDDITDIINRLKSAKKKVVALVPPKKLGVLRSSVNAKLITKAAKQSEKVAVIITSDPSLIKIATTSGLPVAKTLESRPIMPNELMERAKKRAEKAKEEEIVEEPDDDEDVELKKSPKTSGSEKDEININSSEIDDEIEASDKKKKSKSKKNKDDVKIPSFEKYRKWIILAVGVIVALLITAVLIFSNIGSVVINVKVKTTDNNFAEQISLVTDQNAAEVENGKLYLEKVSFEGESNTEFEATGERNDGDKAKGTVTVRYTFTSSDDDGVTVPASTTFGGSGMIYLSDAAKTIANPNDCSRDEYKQVDGKKCVGEVAIPVTAQQGGAAFNLPANSIVETSAPSGVTVHSSSAFNGGTDKVVKVVTEKDIEAAKTQLNADPDAKAKLLEQVSSDVVVISSSFKIEVGDVKTTPAVNEAVGEDGKAKLTAKSTYSIFAVDKAAIEKFIRKQTGQNLAKDQKIYSVGKPFIERFVDDSKNYTAKLKTTYKTGPVVSEKEIMEKSKGKKIGETKTLLESINGVKNVSIDSSFFWVTSVPDDENRVKINLKVEE